MAQRPKQPEKSAAKDGSSTAPIPLNAGPPALRTTLEENRAMRNAQRLSLFTNIASANPYEFRNSYNGLHYDGYLEYLEELKDDIAGYKALHGSELDAHPESKRAKVGLNGSPSRNSVVRTPAMSLGGKRRTFAANESSSPQPFLAVTNTSNPPGSGVTRSSETSERKTMGYDGGGGKTSPQSASQAPQTPENKAINKAASATPGSIIFGGLFPKYEPKKTFARGPRPTSPLKGRGYSNKDLNLIKVEYELYQKENPDSKKRLHAEHLGAYISDMLYEKYGINRTGTAIKLCYQRWVRGRLTNVDDRVTPNPKTLRTSLQGSEKKSQARASRRSADSRKEDGEDESEMDEEDSDGDYEDEN